VTCLTATGDLYRSYTSTDSAKALSYARAMAAAPNARSHWKEAVKVQEILAQAQRHNANGQYQDAATLLDPYCLKSRKDQLNVENATEGSPRFFVAWADAYLGLGKGKEAYERLLGHTAHSYNPVLREVLGRIGKANGKSEAQVKEDLLKALAQKPEPFTAFRLKDYQNRTIDLKDYRGRVVLVNFWFPTCVPCREEFELLKTLYPASGESKVVILTINCAKTLDSSVPKVFAAQHYPFVALKMPDDAWAKRVYGVTGAPSNFLLDREGRLVSRPNISDQYQLESFRNLVDLLNEK